jgi:hypothetical protein
VDETYMFQGEISVGSPYPSAGVIRYRTAFNLLVLP